MPLVALLWIALLQLLAPAGPMRTVLPGCVPSTRGGIAGATAADVRPARGVAAWCHADHGAEMGPPHRPTAAIRKGPHAGGTGPAPDRAIAAVAQGDARAPGPAVAATVADRTTRSVAARGRLLAHLPIPPPLG